MLTQNDKEILEQIIDTWVDSDMPLSSKYSYSNVVATLDKLGVEIPPFLKRLAEEYKKMETDK